VRAARPDRPAVSPARDDDVAAQLASIRMAVEHLTRALTRLVDALDRRQAGPGTVTPLRPDGAPQTRQGGEPNLPVPLPPREGE
jgi:hypothetical protein